MARLPTIIFKQFSTFWQIFKHQRWPLPVNAIDDPVHPQDIPRPRLITSWLSLLFRTTSTVFLRQWSYGEVFIPRFCWFSQLQFKNWSWKDHVQLISPAASQANCFSLAQALGKSPNLWRPEATVEIHSRAKRNIIIILLLGGCWWLDTCTKWKECHYPDITTITKQQRTWSPGTAH